MRTSIVCTTSNVHNTECVELPLYNMRLLYAYFQLLFEHGPKHKSYTFGIINTVCDRNKLMYCSQIESP